MSGPTIHSIDLEKLQRRLDRERRARVEAEKIAETGLRELYENQTKLQLLEEVAASANQATTIRESMQFAVDRICAFTGWPVGHVSLTERNGTESRILPTSIWHCDSERFKEFREATESMPFSEGTGLPGRVLSSGSVAWINDVTQDGNFPRWRSARQVGLRAAFGFPVLTGSEVVGVLEFFSELASEPDDALLRLMSQVGTQLGRVVERVRAEEKLLHDAFHDSLTALPNRALFMDRLQRAVSRAKRHREYVFALLFIDIDRFKIVNDSLGHQAGDTLIIEVARRLLDCLRRDEVTIQASKVNGRPRPAGDDTLARLGGDEFTILLDDIRAPSDGVRVAERIQQALAAPFRLNEQEVFVTASIGITDSSISYNSAGDALRDADTAMYRAKAQGKARCEVFDHGMHEMAVNRLKLESDLRRALEREEFRVYYQPVISLKDGRIAGFEALVRWQRPDVGLVLPGEFISVAEETGMILFIGNWVLRKACQQVHQWHIERPQARLLTISVNISARQFMQDDLVAQVRKVLLETKIEPSALKLEITETVTMGDAARTIKIVTELKKLGVRLSIDDFGTGYSSLSYLRRFPMDTLKIDRSFIHNLDVNSENREIVKTIMALARNLGMDVVAEGTETLGEINHLKELECEFGQGFFFSTPVDSNAALTLLREREPQPEVLIG